MEYTTAIADLLKKKKTFWIYRPYSYSLQDGRSGDRITVKAGFSAPVHTVPVSHRASYTMDFGP
jgi:hypothetical protein